MRAPVFALLLWLPTCGLVFGQAPHPPSARDHERARDAQRRGHFVPLASILADAERREPGKLLEVELDDDEYELEILRADGRVVELEYDARTGRLLEREVEDD